MRVGCARVSTTDQSPELQPEGGGDYYASSEVVGLLYREVLRVPLVVGEGVEADRRMVSVDIRGTPGQLADEATA